MRFRDWSVPQNRPRIADGNHVIIPLAGGLANLRSHLFGRQRRAGRTFATLLLAGRENLDVCATHIYNQHMHHSPRTVTRPLSATAH
jgi:hypothetical protein